MVVFLDSNIYIGAKYRVDRGRFRSLCLLLEHDDIELLYTSVNEGEIKQHIKKDVEEGTQAYNKVLKDKAALLTADEAYHLSKIDVEDGIVCLNGMINNFFSLKGVKQIPIDPISAEDLMKDYFEQKPPFESKKPEEFKDAIIIHAIKEYRKTIDEDIVIISADKGFAAAFDEVDGFVTFGKIDEFLSTRQKQLQEYGIYDCIESFIDDGDANDSIIAYLTNWDINRGYYSGWECESFEIKDVESDFLYSDITDEGVIVHLEVQVWLQAEINHRDEDNSFYDKDEGEYLFESWVDALENHMVKVDIDLDVKIEEDDGAYSVTDYSISEDDEYHWLDIDEDTMTYYRALSSNHMGEPKENLEQCSCCGKILGRNLNGAYFDYDGNPVCEDCMTADGKHEICPHCGRRVPMEHMINGFCDKCISLYDLS